MTIGADPHTLTGAYATDALDDDERRAFEEHLVRCPSCAQEARELTAAAARLGLAAAVAPRSALKDEVLRRLTTVRQEAPRPRPVPQSGTAWHRARRASRWALAACLAAAAGLGGTAVWQHRQADEARETARRAEARSEDLAALLAAPDARARTGKLPGGARATVVVSSSRDRAALLASGMARPPRGKVYQLWFDDKGSMRPAGLMDPDRTTAALLLTGPVGRATGMGITLEPAGGSPEPTAPPVALVRFPA
ncbi:anti-sigma factor [Streptomyces sp. AN091965]|uniref:anti-sigma factor n=1 Tax=Streptomyces sp. AN091965 TaxID=2927803 RepID=UPI001F60A213|nr:anti-sigma factor [Streptomyces sp. AN091965]MCI3935476.1 anti-sigma factor [Streptomyces sp. AN091965]MCI3935490.1 anti-sigma factor [Streptomyces sp. AN091965]